MIVAGEPSGDNHAARLVNQLPDIKFFGMGGKAMQDAGVEIIQNIDQMSVMGLFELLTKLPFLYRVLFKLKRILSQRRPALIILVDYQAFNLKLAKIAKKLGIKTLFYIGPQVWAWRSYRVHKLSKIVDQMAVIFPFEVDFYQQHNMKATFVGHPLVEGIKLQAFDFKEKYKINKTLIAFLPGSRSSEINKHMPIFRQVISQLENNENLELVISRYKKENPATNEQFSNLPNKVKIIDHDYYDMINAADLAVVASGTATLETALLKTPMIMIVKVANLSYLIYRKMVNVPFISIVNIIAGKKIVPELIQQDANAGNIVKHIENLLANNQAMAEMQQGFAMVAQKLAIKPQDSLANLVKKLLSENSRG